MFSLRIALFTLKTIVICQKCKIDIKIGLFIRASCWFQCLMTNSTTHSILPPTITLLDTITILDTVTILNTITILDIFVQV